MARGLANRAFFSMDIPSGLFKAKPLVAGDVTKGGRNESSLQKCFLRQGQFTRNRERRGRDESLRVSPFLGHFYSRSREMKSARRKLFRL